MAYFSDIFKFLDIWSTWPIANTVWYNHRMRLLGVDYGSKRIGIALSDEGLQFAMPLAVVSNSKDTLNEVVGIAQKHGVVDIVLGESKDYKGQANAILEQSLKFKDALEQQGFVVHLEPEFMTSTNAERFQGKTDMLDASAAALILQSFLDKQRAKG